MTDGRSPRSSGPPSPSSGAQRLLRVRHPLFCTAGSSLLGAPTAAVVTSGHPSWGEAAWSLPCPSRCLPSPPRSVGPAWKRRSRDGEDDPDDLPRASDTLPKGTGPLGEPCPGPPNGGGSRGRRKPELQGPPAPRPQDSRGGRGPGSSRGCLRPPRHRVAQLSPRCGRALRVTTTPAAENLPRAKSPLCCLASSSASFQLAPGCGSPVRRSGAFLLQTHHSVGLWPVLNAVSVLPRSQEESALLPGGRGAPSPPAREREVVEGPGIHLERAQIAASLSLLFL